MTDNDRNQCPNCGAENDSDARFCRKCGEPLGETQPALVEAQNNAAVGALNKEITSITDPLLKMVDTSPDALIVASLQRVLDEAGPRQAEVLRRCAIPHWFDLGVLAMLRERDDGNERVLELLRGYSFVRQLGDQRYAYHDAVR